ncbi:MAG: hypothetical protein IKM53_05955, partial [Clostridia bacterium]|nr:hypothetical protein [Clostridia bacterium]
MMKRLTALVLSLIMVIGCFAFTVSAEDSDYNNWAADKDAKYTVSVVDQWGGTDITWRGGNEDAGNKLLTDGKYSDATTLADNGGAEVAGTSVAMMGRKATYTYIFNLGKAREFQGLKLLNVRQDLGEGTSDRGLDVITFGYSTNGTEFKDFAVTEQALIVSDVAATAKNIIVDAASLAGGNVTAQCVKVVTYSTGYVASLDEIQIWDVIPEIQVATNATLEDLYIYGVHEEFGFYWPDLYGTDATEEDGYFVSNLYDRAGAHKYVSLVPGNSIYLALDAFKSADLGELDAPGYNKIYGDNSVIFIVDVSDTLSAKSIAKVKAAIAEIANSLYDAKYAKFTKQEFAVVVCNDSTYNSGWTAIDKLDKAIEKVDADGVTDIDAAIAAAEELAASASTEKVSCIVIGDGQFDTEAVLEDTYALQVTEWNVDHNEAGAEAYKALVGEDNYAVLSDKAVDALLAKYLEAGIGESFWLDPTITVSVNGGEAVKYANGHYGHKVEDCTEIAEMESIRTDVSSKVEGDFNAVIDPEKEDAFAVSLYETAKSVGTNQIKFTTTYKLAEKDYGAARMASDLTINSVIVNVETVVSVAVDGTITIVSEEFSYETTEGSYDDADNYLVTIKSYPKQTSERVGKIVCTPWDDCDHDEDDAHIELTEFQFETIYDWSTIADEAGALHILLEEGKNEIVVTVSAPCYESTTYTINVFNATNYVADAEYVSDLGDGKYFVDKEENEDYTDKDFYLTDGKCDDVVAVEGDSYTVVFDLGEKKSDIFMIYLCDVVDENMNTKGYAAIDEIIVSVSDDAENWTVVDTPVEANAFSGDRYDFVYTTDFVNEEYISGQYVKVEFVGSSSYIVLDEIEVWGLNTVAEDVPPVDPAVAKGDVNADGTVDSIDAAVILQTDAEL